MTAETTQTGAEAEIRQTMESWLTAARAKDVDGICAHYAPDVVVYDAIVALRFVGVDAYRDHWRMCMEHCPGDLVFELHAPTIAAAGDVGFAWSLMRCGGTKEDGTKEPGWMRMTTCFRKTGGRWQIVHEHFSAPFDMESGKALFGLEP